MSNMPFKISLEVFANRQCEASKKSGLEVEVNLDEKARPLPKFGEWDVNDPTSAESFTVIFNKARDDNKTGEKPDSPTKVNTNARHGAEPFKPQAKKWWCCM